ncbi:MAG: HAD-IA family hydrolase [Chitinivibrionales bacterium]|nr:HAD-IA family hydrolase [Chitinivibrionales bacterium]
MTILPALQDYRGVIFDLDGTLYKMQWHLRVLITLLVFPQMSLLPRYIKAHNSFADMDVESGEQLTYLLCKKLSESSNTNLTQAKTWIEKKFYPAFVSAMGFFRNSRPGLPDLLSRLKSSGKKLAVLSDYGCVAQRLGRLGLDVSLFDEITSSETAGALKPCARPFQQIADSFGMPGSKIVVVGDRNDTDGEAAQRCSMQFVHVAGSQKHAAGSLAWEEVVNLFAATLA